MDADTFEPCIQCGHRSKAAITLTSGKEIFMCAHHARHNLDDLIAKGAFIVWDARESAA